MEGVGRLGAPESEPTQPDLLAEFSEVQGTAFGVTGTFKELAEMCPIDLNDPKITLEAKNVFVVKLANESGLEIKPEHEMIFDKVIQDNKLEKKFTIVATKQNEDKPKVDIEPTVVALRPDINVAPKTSKAVGNLLSRIRKTIIVAEALKQDPVDTTQTLPTLKSRPLKERSTKKLNSTKEHSSFMFKEKTTAKPDTLMSSVFAEESVVVSAVINSSVEQEDYTPPAKVHESLVATPDATEESYRPVLDSSEDLKSVDSTTMHFMEDLKSVISVYELTQTVVGVNDSEHVKHFIVEDDERELVTFGTEKLSQIISSLESMDSLKQQIVEPILEDISIVLCEIKTLDLEDIDSAELIQEKLEKLVTTLAKELEIDCSQVDIQQLVKLISHSRLEKIIGLSEVDILNPDLENEGTHEAKIKLKITADLTDSEKSLHKLLGNFALLYSGLTKNSAN